MASKKLGNLIKEARTEAGLTQEQLKQIARITGVTQTSLLEAAKGSKKTSSSTAAKSSMRVTATEKRLVELYREADSKTKKAALKLLRGEDYFSEEVLTNILEEVTDIITGK